MKWSFNIHLRTGVYGKPNHLWRTRLPLERLKGIKPLSTGSYPVVLFIRLKTHISFPFLIYYNNYIIILKKSQLFYFLILSFKNGRSRRNWTFIFGFGFGFGFGVRHTAVVLYFLVLTQGFEPQSLAYKVSTLSLS